MSKVKVLLIIILSMFSCRFGYVCVGAEELSDLVIVIQPKSVTVREEEAAVFRVKARGNGLKYQWQYSQDNGKTWKNSSIAAAKTEEYTIKAGKANCDQKFRCVITDENGIDENSEIVGINLVSGPEITKQPESVTVREGEAAVFRVKARGNGLKYQWQYSQDNGKTWKNSSIAAAKTEEYTIKAGKANCDQKFRCVITDENGIDENSEIVGINLVSGPEITKQPESVTVREGEAAVFRVKARGNGLKYQWQYSQDNGKTWKNSSIAAAKTEEYTIKAGKANCDQKFRCVITDENGIDENSEIVGINLVSGPEITKQPESVTVREGEAAVFRVKARGNGLKYQWQYSQDNGKTWKNSSIAAAKTEEYTIKAGKANCDQKFRCVIMDIYGVESISDSTYILLLEGFETDIL